MWEKRLLEIITGVGRRGRGGETETVVVRRRTRGEEVVDAERSIAFLGERRGGWGQGAHRHLFRGTGVSRQQRHQTKCKCRAPADTKRTLEGASPK